MVHSYSFSHGFLATVEAACCCRRDSELATSSNAFRDEDEEYSEANCKKRLLIFVNPRSGAGRSAQVFSKQVEPKFIANGIKYDLIVTEHQYHARDYIASLKELHLYNGILIVSGDGLVFEVVNALIERQDATFLPIGIIPSGSGNGLLSSVFYQNRYSLKNPEFLIRAIDNVCNANAVAYPVNLMHVETPTKSYAATITIGFGLFADIDIESERWRKPLESARFTAGALVRFFSLRTYRCKLSYCLSRDDEEFSSAVFPEPFKVYPGSSAIDNLSVESKQPSFSEDVESSNSFLSDYLRQSYFQKSIPKVCEPIPSDWIVIDDEFLFIYALAVSHASQDVPFVPDAQLCDRNIYLCYALKKDLQSRFDLLKFLSDIKHAKHINYSFLKIVPVKSFRFEKTAKPPVGGYVTVDGEVIETDVLQATNTFSTISVITA